MKYCNSYMADQRHVNMVLEKRPTMSRRINLGGYGYSNYGGCQVRRIDRGSNVDNVAIEVKSDREENEEIMKAI